MRACNAFRFFFFKRREKRENRKCHEYLISRRVWGEKLRNNKIMKSSIREYEYNFSFRGFGWKVEQRDGGGGGVQRGTFVVGMQNSCCRRLRSNWFTFMVMQLIAGGLARFIWSFRIIFIEMNYENKIKRSGLTFMALMDKWLNSFVSLWIFIYVFFLMPGDEMAEGSPSRSYQNMCLER